MPRRTKCIGVIGPTNTTLIESEVGLFEGLLERKAAQMGAWLAEHSFGLSCVPAAGVGLMVLESYKSAGGDASLALSPRPSGEGGTPSDLVRRNASIADEIREDLTWEQQPFELARTCDYLVAIGLSCGTIIEMTVTKWLQGPPILVVSSLITCIPEEVLAEIRVKFFDDIEALQDALLKEVGPLPGSRTGLPG
ncbi:hypothetical protein ACFL2Q_01130 [Thermodesulfobacteriota bacterium]